MWMLFGELMIATDIISDRYKIATVYFATDFLNAFTLNSRGKTLTVLLPTARKREVHVPLFIAMLDEQNAVRGWIEDNRFCRVAN